MKTKPAPELKLECKNCEKLKECFDQGIENHIFDLPRLRASNKMNLIGSNI